MHSQSTTQKDSAIAVTPMVQPRMPWRVMSVKAMPGFKLYVGFVDGTENQPALASSIHAPDAGVFAVLADATLFAQVFVDCGAVTWPGELDLAPDDMYRRIKNRC